MPKSVQPIEPLPGFAVLKEYKLNEKIAGRLLMPTDAQNAPSLGEVISIGGARAAHDGKAEQRALDLAVLLTLSVGDVMAYQNYGGQELMLGGQKYFIVPFDKLLAKLNIKESK